MTKRRAIIKSLGFDGSMCGPGRVEIKLSILMEGDKEGSFSKEDIDFYTALCQAMEENVGRLKVAFFIKKEVEL